MSASSPGGEGTLFLPTSRAELARRGWDAVDVVLITGDAYVDHPSFGVAVIGRVLEAAGFRVGVIPQPDWSDPGSVARLGRPRLFFGVSGGNVDSMLARQTAFLRRRRDDPYAAGGRAGQRPPRAVIVYSNLVRAAFKGVPVVLGGIEASMRRVAHYDFWSDRLRRSILEDARGDLLIYGMGEAAAVEAARRLASGRPLVDIRNTAYLAAEAPAGALLLPSEERVLSAPEAFSGFYRDFYRNQQRVLAQPAGGRFIVHQPPVALDQQQLDEVYRLPYARAPHPRYDEPVPAFEMIRSSVTAHRGCVSGCAFCSLGLHQGRRIVCRSSASVLQEVRQIVAAPGSGGLISDIGGPSANMYGIDCARRWRCKRTSCTFPHLCRGLRLGATAWVDLLARAAAQPGVRRVTVGSGLRYDLLARDPAARDLLRALVRHHVSGQLKIAPEHTEPAVLRTMRKTPLADLRAFVGDFGRASAAAGKEQFLLPYLLSCHPGAGIEHARRQRRRIREIFGFVPRQVQAFIPLPSTLAATIYFTGRDPLSGASVEVVRDARARRQQHELLLRGGR